MWNDYKIFLIFLTTLAGCRGCIDQYDPTDEWAQFEKERRVTQEKFYELGENGEVLDAEPSSEGGEVAESVGDQKYTQLCASCHGNDGQAADAVAQAMNPKPRNFVTWNDSSITDDYIAKIIKEGGAAVGKSSTMPAWGALLSDDEVTAVVEKVRSFQK